MSKSLYKDRTGLILTRIGRKDQRQEVDLPDRIDDYSTVTPSYE